MTASGEFTFEVSITGTPMLVADGLRSTKSEWRDDFAGGKVTNATGACRSSVSVRRTTSEDSTAPTRTIRIGIGLFQGLVARFFTQEDDRKRSPHNLHVQRDRAVIDVPDIQHDSLGPWDFDVAVDLGPSSEPRPHFQAAFLKPG